MTTAATFRPMCPPVPGRELMIGALEFGQVGLLPQGGCDACVGGKHEGIYAASSSLQAE